MCFFTAVLLVYCNQSTSKGKKNPAYLNLNDTVAYMGMETCKNCHANVHNTFIHTGMGRSFDVASPKKSAASYGNHAVVYDENSDFYYKPFFKNNKLFITEFRLENGDTTHKRTEQVSYIIGSGQHTNSHIIDINGYIFQAPITYYTQKGHWAMAPGYQGENLRFDRTLPPECITCHNHFPDFVEGSDNKYNSMPRGIECERCHGPGEIHVQERLKGRLVDTSKYIDYTIVNPSDLPRSLQMDLCQRCHLQGIAVLEDGKTFFDFKPGMQLSEVFNVFLPRYSNSHERFIMASQADRLRESKCFTETEDLSCLTCHNPHVSIETTDQQVYNKVCLSCHRESGQKLCSESKEELQNAGNNCVSCHMPPSGSIDIPHVRITDHYISKKTAVRKDTISQADKNEIVRFLGLKMLTKAKASPLEMAKGYIALFDKYTATKEVLDSAKYYLDLSVLSEKQKFKTLVHYHFAAENYDSILLLVQGIHPREIKDGWTAYRLGEACFKQNDFSKALLFYKSATVAEPLNLDFQEKLGVAYAGMNSLPQALQVFEFIIKENPKRKLAQSNLGFVKMLLKRYEEAGQHYDKAIALDPDYEQALLNKAKWYFLKDNQPAGQQLLNRILKINPDNREVRDLLEKVSG